MPDTPPPRFSVIIVNYNAGDRLRRTLDCLAVQKSTPLEVIVVDNASSDQSIAQAQESRQRFRLIKPGENTGFARGNNLAAAEALGDWLVFLNPDAYPEPDWLAAIATGIEQYPWADAFGSTQLSADDPSRYDGRGDVFYFAGLVYRGDFGATVRDDIEDGECFAPCAAAAAYRRETFISLDGFEERFFCYCEDVDLAFRMRLAGGRAVQLAKARVLHEGSALTGRVSNFTVYHGHRNRIWTYMRNMPLALLVVTLPFHLLVNLALVLQMMASGAIAPYLRALRDGFLQIGPQLKARRDIQAKRRVSAIDVLRMLTCSPLKVLERAADLRGIKSGAERASSDRATQR